MKLIRRFLYKTMGLESYLRMVSKWYIRLVSLGFFKENHAEIHHLSKMVNKGDVCVDIGANLGYYSVFLSQLAGDKGKVLAVEPIPLFQKIWKHNTRKTGIENLHLLPYALGETECEIQMGMPSFEGVIHHGMTKVVDQQNKQQGFEVYFTAEMKRPDQLFLNEERLDFIKMDIEGYEYIALQNMQETIKKFKPKVQMEISKNRDEIIALMQQFGYQIYGLKNGQLERLDSQAIAKHKKDFYFLVS